MIVVDPKPIVMLSSTVPEDEYPPYNSGTSYANEARCIYEHYVWQSMADANQGNTPGSGTSWSRVQATNQRMMIDGSLSTCTVDDLNITVETQSQACTHFALFGCYAETLTWSLYDLTVGGDEPVGTETVNLRLDRVDNLLDYYYAPFRYRRDMLIPLPLRHNAKLELTLSSTGVVSLGHMVQGQAFEIGKTGWSPNPSVDTMDFSTVETDQWGNTYLFKGKNAKTLSVGVNYPSSRLDVIHQKLADLRGRAAVWSANNIDDDTAYQAWLVYGMANASNQPLNNPLRGSVALDIDGLT